MTKSQQGVIKVTIDYCVVNAKRRSRRFYSSKNQPPTTNSHGKNRAAVILTVISKQYRDWAVIGHFMLWHGHCDSHLVILKCDIVIVTVILCVYDSHCGSLRVIVGHCDGHCDSSDSISDSETSDSIYCYSIEELETIVLVQKSASDHSYLARNDKY